RQRDGESPDASTNSGQSTLESVPKVNSFTHESTVLAGHTTRADFEAKYMELEQLGQGGFGTVYAGNRRSDDLPIIMKQLVNAAIDLQAKGIFHQDLKLANILIEPSTDGLRVRIIDFGCGYIQ
ncbi:unnamed protein product, partial [Pleuronectes platessa]